jgi:putative acetyltransferase
VQIRAEQTQDYAAVFALNTAAFDSAAEAKLVDRLRGECGDLISLVAVDDDDIVGHILFSPVTLDTENAPKIFGLGPMAVTPECQRQGIGSALVEAGLEQCRAKGIDAVIVLGHPAFYPRFGFVPASRFGIDSEFPAPDEAFMAIELTPGVLADHSGQARYHPAFSDV